MFSVLRACLAIYDGAAKSGWSIEGLREGLSYAHFWFGDPKDIVYYGWGFSPNTWYELSVMLPLEPTVFGAVLLLVITEYDV
jgi:hypothetical protein